MWYLILAVIVALVVVGCASIWFLDSRVNRPELLLDFLKHACANPVVVGQLTIVFEGKSYTLGSPRPPLRPIVVRVHDVRFFGHVLTYRNLGMGESYMFGWFDLDPGTSEKPYADLYGMLSFFFVNGMDKKGRSPPPFWLVLRCLSPWLVYKIKGHKHAIDVHYNENPEMYRDMLGATQGYTCGYTTHENSALPASWRNELNPVAVSPKDVPPIKSFKDIEHLCVQPTDVPGFAEPRSEFLLHPLDLPELDLRLDTDGLQRAKFDRVCRKLRLRPGQRLLDMGCGYGGFLMHAAKHYGIQGVGFCITQQMIDGATAAAKAAGLEDRLKFIFGDLTLLNTFPDATFDAIASIGCMEHVHRHEYTFVFTRFQALLKHDGMILLHMLCSPQKPNVQDAFIQTYLFPNSNQAIASELLHELEIRTMRILDVEDIGSNYCYTLHCWWTNLKKHFDAHPGKYSFAYQKMMEYYLLGCKAMSAHGSGTVQQILATKNSRSKFRALYRYS